MISKLQASWFCLRIGHGWTVEDVVLGPSMGPAVWEDIFKFWSIRPYLIQAWKVVFFVHLRKLTARFRIMCLGWPSPNVRSWLDPGTYIPMRVFVSLTLDIWIFFIFHDHIMTYDHIRWTVKTIILIITISGFIYVISCHACNIDEFSQNDHGVQACFPCANAGRPWCPGGSVRHKSDGKRWHDP